MHRPALTLMFLTTALSPVAAAQTCPVEAQWPAREVDGIRYGRSIACNGTFIAVGDYSADSYRGRVNLFGWDGDEWVRAAAIEGIDPHEEFGNTVQMSGDWMAITAPEAGNGIVELWHYHEDDWHFEDSYQSPAGARLSHTHLSWPHLALVELTEEGQAQVYCLTHDEETDDWNKGPLIDSRSHPWVEVTVSNGLLAVSEPAHSDLFHDYCGLVRRWQLEDGTWTFVHSIGFSWDWALGGQTLTSSGNLQAWSLQGYYATGRTHHTSMLMASRFEEGAWSSVSIERGGEALWTAPGSQINHIALDGEDMVVTLWVMDPDTSVSTWSSHHFRHSGIAFHYHQELTLPGHDNGAPMYVAAIHDGMVVFDCAVDDTERVIVTVPLDDCDGSGRSDACEVLADGADTDADDTLDRCECPGDLDHDGTRDGDDLTAFLDRWGSDTAHGDLDGDGSTGMLDLVELLLHWGDCD